MEPILSDNFRMHLHPDLVEEITISETEKVIYAGIFAKGKDEHSEDGCNIRRTTVITKDDKTTVKIEYAGGCAHTFGHAWAKRADANTKYRFASK